MLIAQITDLHLGFDPDDPDEFNRQRLDRTLAALCVLHPTPDLLLVTGDIADNGDDGLSYRRYAEAIGVLPFPAWPMMGNHDSRAPFLAQFPETGTADDFIQYEIDAGPIRFIHAAWVPSAIASLPPTLATDDLVRETGKGGRLHAAIEVAIKGPEEDAAPHPDAFGRTRRKRRIRWWEDYPADEPVVCFGHYWFRGTPHVLGPGGNAICLDYSCGLGEPLVAYRWPERSFVVMPNHDARRPGFRISEG